jgi:hypothetical protein
MIISNQDVAINCQLQAFPLQGKGDPADVAFSENIQALYSVAYAVKFACKTMEKDFVFPNRKDFGGLMRKI